MELPDYVNASKKVLPDLINLTKVDAVAPDEIWQYYLGLLCGEVDK